MPADFWPRLAIALLGAAMGYSTFREARATSPDPRYSSRAVRVVWWLFSIALILAGLSGVSGNSALLVVVLGLMIAGLLWWLCLFGSTMLAPAWAARVWFQAFAAACAIGPNTRVPTLADSEREARKLGLSFVGLAALVFVGYYLATRWLGIFLLPLAFVLLVIVAGVRVFRPRQPREIARVVNTNVL